MNLDFKYLLTLGVGLAAIVVFALAVTGVINLYWFIPAVFAALGCSVLLYYYNIPAAEERQKELAEYGRQLLEAEGYTFEKIDE